MSDTDVLFRRWLSDLASPDSKWKYGDGVPIAPDAKSFLAEFDRLRERAGELERKHGSCNTKLEILRAVRGRHITDEQNQRADAAWKFNEDSSHQLRGHGRALLYSCFVIDYCKKCGGAGGLTDNLPPLPHHKDRAPCPDCNGHGWVIGGEDE